MSSDVISPGTWAPTVSHAKPFVERYTSRPLATKIWPCGSTAKSAMLRPNPDGTHVAPPSSERYKFVLVDTYTVPAGCVATSSADEIPITVVQFAPSSSDRYKPPADTAKTDPSAARAIDRMAE